MLHDTSYKVLLKPDKIKTDGSMPIYIRITKHRKTSYFSIGESCLKLEWNEKAERLWESKPRITEKERKNLNNEHIKHLEKTYQNIKIHPNAKRINAKIEDKLDEFEDAEKDLRNKKEAVSVKKIRDKVIDIRPSDRSFLKFYQERLEKNIKTELEYNTYRGYSGTYNKLVEYQKDKDLVFEDIDYDYLENFYFWLLKKNYEPETIKKHFKWMQAIWKNAKKKRLVITNPFEDFEIRTGEKKYKERLTKDEIKLLIDIKLTGRMNDARNAFLFAFFHAGMRISDILKLKWECISNDRLSYKMKKNKKSPDLKLHPIGKTILEFYNHDDTKPSDYVFGLMENNLDENTEYFEKQIQSKTSLINNNLKKVAKIAGIEKKLTTHIARHSYGGTALEENINAFDLSYSLMHSKVQTTDTYAGGANAKRMDKILDNVYKDFSDTKFSID